jgi:hypothetical protein
MIRGAKKAGFGSVPNLRGILYKSRHMRGSSGLTSENIDGGEARADGTHDPVRGGALPAWMTGSDTLELEVEEMVRGCVWETDEREKERLPKQRSELEFEMRRLDNVCQACKSTTDKAKWMEAIEAQKSIRVIRKLISSGKYPTSQELEAKVSDLVRAIEKKVENGSLALPLRTRLEQLQQALALELEAEARVRRAESYDSNVILSALRSTDPAYEMGTVSMEYLASITNNWTDEVGSGGFGVVFKGRDAQSSLVVAVKKIPNDKLHDHERKQFKNEIEVRY